VHKKFLFNCFDANVIKFSKRSHVLTISKATQMV
jgi:hypothetical protein